MRTKTLAIILILLSLFLVCSCKTEPEVSGEAEITLKVGVSAFADIITKWQEDGSYPGLNVVLGDNYVMVLNFTNCSTTLDLSSVDPSLGTKTVTINGQVSYKYEEYPEAYPVTMTYNISFQFGGAPHTLEANIRATGVSTMKATNIKIDGKKYKDESI